MNGPKESLRKEDSPGGIKRMTASDSDPIATELRKLYEDAAREPLPSDLTALLDQLAAAEHGK